MAAEPSNENGAQLPRQLRSLIHHIELHRSGWWDRALERLVLVTVWRQAPATIDDVMTVLAGALDGRLDRERVETVIAQAEASGTLIETSNGRYRPAEQVDKALRTELETVRASEELVQERLINLAAAKGISVEPAALWTDFEDLFMVPLIQEAGARIYDVLTSGAAIDAKIPTFRQILEPLCERYGNEVRSVLVDFLDPSDADVRAYVLRALNADFVREAAGLESSVLASLRVSRGRPDRVRVFLDTNFVFSFLELHDNPSNEVAADLIHLIGRAKSTIKVELFVLPITVEETRRVLREVMIRLKGIVPLPNLAAAAQQLSSTGLVSRFLQAASAHRDGRLSPEDFFGPYESSLVPILRERGVELFNVELDELRVDQAVIDDLHDQTEAQKRLRKKGPKSYDSNLHDMVLWHFTSRQRPAAVDSPLELGNWACTVDYGLVAFDRHKRRGSQSPPVCLTPSSLIQLLQFWAPRTAELDRALVGAIREPLLFLDFDLATEQATLRILRSISRFEDIGDLGPSTIYNILTNDALRARLNAPQSLSEKEEIALVETAVVDEARRLEEELARIASEREDVEMASQFTISEKVREAESLREVVAKRDEDVSALSTVVDQLRERLADEQASSQSRVEALEARLGDIEVDKRRARERLRVALMLAGVIIIVLTAVAVSGRALEDRFGRAEWVAWAGVSTVALLVLLLAADVVMMASSIYRDHFFRRVVIRGRKLIVVVLVGVLSSLVATAIWETFDERSGAREGSSRTRISPWLRLEVSGGR